MNKEISHICLIGNPRSPSIKARLKVLSVISNSNATTWPEEGILFSEIQRIERINEFWICSDLGSPSIRYSALRFGPFRLELDFTQDWPWFLEHHFPMSKVFDCKGTRLLPSSSDLLNNHLVRLKGLMQFFHDLSNFQSILKADRPSSVQEAASWIVELRLPVLHPMAYFAKARNWERWDFGDTTLAFKKRFANLIGYLWPDQIMEIQDGSSGHCFSLLCRLFMAQAGIGCSDTTFTQLAESFLNDGEMNT